MYCGENGFAKRFKSRYKFDINKMVGSQDLDKEPKCRKDFLQSRGVQKGAFFDRGVHFVRNRFIN
ncbi:MAG TPA: hypothetical protein DCY58_07140 [Acetobacterium sp.]|nr:hypothetical protein [Acetobacterium sp.]